VRQSELKAALEHMEETFALELTHGYVKPIQVDSNVGLIAVVGEGMRGTPGLAGRIFTAISRHNINIIAIAQGSSELTIAIVVRREGLERAVRAVDARRRPLVVAGDEVVEHAAGSGEAGARVRRAVVEVIGAPAVRLRLVAAALDERSARAAPAEPPTAPVLAARASETLNEPGFDQVSGIENDNRNGRRRGCTPLARNPTRRTEDGWAPTCCDKGNRAPANPMNSRRFIPSV